MKTTRLIACFVLGILTPGTILAQESDPELEGAEEAPPIEAGPRAEPAPATEPPADETDDLFTRAPARGKGAIVGLVSDDKTGEGVFDAQIAVVGRKEVVTADVDGRFRRALTRCASTTSSTALDVFRMSR
jgi:hypothetical protein